MIEQLHSGNKFGMQRSGNKKLLYVNILVLLHKSFQIYGILSVCAEGHLQFMFVYARVGARSGYSGWQD